MSTIKVDTLQTRTGNTAAVTGAGFVATDQIRGNTSAGSTTVVAEGGTNTTNLQQGLAKAWIVQHSNTNIGDSLNISSLTDNAVGDASFAFTTSMNSTSHALLGIMQSGSNRANIMIIHGTMATDSGRCRFGNHNADTSANDITLFDDNFVKNVTFGDLA